MCCWSSGFGPGLSVAVAERHYSSYGLAVRADMFNQCPGHRIVRTFQDEYGIPVSSGIRNLPKWVGGDGIDVFIVLLPLTFAFSYFFSLISKVRMYLCPSFLLSGISHSFSFYSHD